MKILALTRYGELGASSRMRMLQFLPYFSEHELDVDVSPFFSDAYLNALYQKRPRLSTILSSYWTRFGICLGAAKYDVVWLEKEIFPFLPAFAERILSFMGVNIVSDYDDALFHRYDMHSNKLIRYLLGHKIDIVMRKSALVVAGNTYLAKHAGDAGAQRVEIMPTVVALSNYPKRSYVERDGLVIGWIGSPTTAKYLENIAPALRKIQRRFNARVRVVGAGEFKLEGCEIEHVDWIEAEEGNQVACFDIGVMPLPDTPWERGKCGYKLIQYMACGLPVVASPVGINTKIVMHNKNGLLAETSEQWERALEILCMDESLRRTMGKVGRRTVEKEYSLDIAAPQVLNLLVSTLGE